MPTPRPDVSLACSRVLCPSLNIAATSCSRAPGSEADVVAQRLTERQRRAQRESRSTETTKTKKNLLLFLTPYIIRSQADLQAIYERKIRERQEFVDHYFVFNDGECSVPVDYSRTRGLIAEMLRELKTIDAEKKLALDAQRKPEPGHPPRAPIGGKAMDGQES